VTAFPGMTSLPPGSLGLNNVHINQGRSHINEINQGHSHINWIIYILIGSFTYNFNINYLICVLIKGGRERVKRALTLPSSLFTYDATSGYHGVKRSLTPPPYLFTSRDSDVTSSGKGGGLLLSFMRI